MTTLVNFSGLPGTGKSTHANRLAREQKWPILRIDDVVGFVPENAGIAFWDSCVEVLLTLVESQLELGISVIADSVFMNTDRHHAQAVAIKHQSTFRPVYTFLSDDAVWEARVTARANELNHPDVSTWEQVQHQRDHFRIWEPDTALFVDALNPVDQNYSKVLEFATGRSVELKPLEMPDKPLIKGSYHA
jgi:predicted kinase